MKGLYDDILYELAVRENMEDYDIFANCMLNITGYPYETNDVISDIIKIERTNETIAESIKKMNDICVRNGLELAFKGDLNSSKDVSNFVKERSDESWAAFKAREEKLRKLNEECPEGESVSFVDLMMIEHKEYRKQLEIDKKKYKEGKSF